MAAKKGLENVEARALEGQKPKATKKRKLPVAEEIVLPLAGVCDRNTILDALSQEPATWNLAQNDDVQTSEAEKRTVEDHTAANEESDTEEGESLVSEDVSHEEALNVASEESVETSSTLDDISWEDVERYDVEGAETPKWPKNLGPRIDLQNLPPQSLWASRQAKEAAAQLPWESERKLRSTEIAMESLILALLHDANICAEGKQVENVHSSIQRLARMRRCKLADLRQKYAAFNLSAVPAKAFEYWYSKMKSTLSRMVGLNVQYEMDDGSFVKGRENLNRSLSKLFVACFGGDLSIAELNARVSHEIVSSNAPPDYRTWNILLVGFTKVKDNQAVGNVMSAQEQAHNRANETTCAAILNHLSATNDIAGFTKFVDKMRGLYGGLMLARPSLPITPHSTQRLVLHPFAKERKVIQKMHPTPIVYKAIISGVVKFGGFDMAVQLCEELNSDGWGLDKLTLGVLLDACTKEKDFANGLKIWDQYKSLESWSTKSSHETRICADMLVLCLLSEKTRMFNSVLRQACDFGYDLQALKRMVIESQPFQKRKIVGRELDLLVSDNRRRMAWDLKMKRRRPDDAEPPKTPYRRLERGQSTLDTSEDTIRTDGEAASVQTSQPNLQANSSLDPGHWQPTQHLDSDISVSTFRGETDESWKTSSDGDEWTYTYPAWPGPHARQETAEFELITPEKVKAVEHCSG